MNPQLNQIKQTVQQLIQQTQQSSAGYQQMLQLEIQNAQTLEQLAQRERQAARATQQALRSHQSVILQLQFIGQACNNLETETPQSFVIPYSTQSQPAGTHILH